MENYPDRAIVRRQLSTDEENPGPEIAEIVADLEDRDMSELGTMYDCVDGVLDHLFSKPPAEDAGMRIEFSYEGYRIAVEQDGLVELVKGET